MSRCSCCCTESQLVAKCKQCDCPRCSTCMIAAAPDLLEALTKAADTLMSARAYIHGRNEDATQAMRGAMAIAESRARAAIAKAKGEEPFNALLDLLEACKAEHSSQGDGPQLLRDAAADLRSVGKLGGASALDIMADRIEAAIAKATGQGEQP